MKREFGRYMIAQVTLAVVVILLLLGGSLWVMRPFIGPGIWAAMIVVTTWPIMRRVQGLLWGRRWLATLVMTLLLVLLFAVPLLAAVGTIVGNAEEMAGWARAVASFRLKEPPAWLAGLPMVGPSLALLWQQLGAAGFDGLLERVTPYAGNVTRWFVAEVGQLGFLLLQFVLTVLLAAVMYAQGERWASTALRVGRRLAGRRGEHVVQLAGESIRGVALGVGVTAVVQASLGGLALWIAGVPFAGLLTAVMLMLCLAQLGPMPVLLAAAGWLLWQGQTGWGIFLLAASAVVGTIDNVIKPVLIRLGADLPLLLILVGVIGGLFAFGLVGIFVGPVILAVAWTLMLAWIGDDRELLERGLEPVPQQLQPGQQHAQLEQPVEQPRRDSPHHPHAEPDA